MAILNGPTARLLLWGRNLYRISNLSGAVEKVRHSTGAASRAARVNRKGQR